MYCISEKQIDFILNDISARGIEMVSLQQDLLDHVCCIIEQNLKEDGDFECFYFSCIEQFYNQDLKEIETETINLLIHKNYYVMKKIMLISGGLSSLSLCIGIVFKFMHWPGAAALIVLGILMMSLIFLPIYYFSGIRNPETKVNTIVSSILIVAGCALILALVRSPQGTRKLYVQTTSTYLRNEQILQKEHDLAMKSASEIEKSGLEIYNSCEKLKELLLKKETGVTKIESNFDAKNTLISESLVSDFLSMNDTSDLKKQIESYNLKLDANKQKIPTDNSFFDSENMKVDAVLNNLLQIQMIVLQNQRA